MTNELQIFCSLPKCEKDADTECIDCEYMVREEPKKRMTPQEAIEELRDASDSEVRYGDAEHHYDEVMKRVEALEMAIKALEQESITWIVGKDNCQVAVRNMPIDKIQKICAIIRDEEQQPKRGKWIEVEVHNCHATLKCSECDRVIEPTYTFGEYSYEAIKKFYPYCHCGAKMEVEE